MALLTNTLNLASLIDSPAANAGTANRTYGVARVALPEVSSTSANNVVCPPDVADGLC